MKAGVCLHYILIAHYFLDFFFDDFFAPFDFDFVFFFAAIGFSPKSQTTQTLKIFTLHINESKRTIKRPNGVKMHTHIDTQTQEKNDEEHSTNQRPGNVVYIGQKMVMGYVYAVLTQFNNGAKEVTIKARGRVISKAVDVEQIVKNKFKFNNIRTESISTSTESVTSEDGSTSNVSAIEIKLAV